MASLNKCTLIATLGKDPETRFMPNGNAVCNFSVATNETWKDKDGKKQENVTWHNIVMFGKLAEIAGQYLKKGSSVYIEGRLQNRKWQDKTSGQDRYSTEIIADEMKMLGGKPADSSSESHAAPAKQAGKPPAQPDPWLAEFDDDLPQF